MADGPIRLILVTPERALIDDHVEEIQAPGAQGCLGILPGHALLFSELKVGELGFRKGNSWSWLSVAWGFMEVLPDQVRVLAETANAPRKSMWLAPPARRNAQNSGSAKAVKTWITIAP